MITQLPFEILLDIISLLDQVSLTHLFSINKYFRFLSENKTIINAISTKMNQMVKQRDPNHKAVRIDAISRYVHGYISILPVYRLEFYRDNVIKTRMTFLDYLIIERNLDIYSMAISALKLYPDYHQYAVVEISLWNGDSKITDIEYGKMEIRSIKWWKSTLFFKHIKECFCFSPLSELYLTVQPHIRRSGSYNECTHDLYMEIYPDDGLLVQ